MSVASLFTPCFVMFCVFVYGPFCHGAHKLDLSTLFTTFFLWTSPPFILWSGLKTSKLIFVYLSMDSFHNHSNNTPYNPTYLLPIQLYKSDFNIIDKLYVWGSNRYICSSCIDMSSSSSFVNFSTKVEI